MMIDNMIMMSMMRNMMVILMMIVMVIMASIDCYRLLMIKGFQLSGDSSDSLTMCLYDCHHFYLHLYSQSSLPSLSI